MYEFILVVVFNSYQSGSIDHVKTETLKECIAVGTEWEKASIEVTHRTKYKTLTYRCVRVKKGE